MNKRDPWTDKDIETLQRMWREGYSSYAIADAVNRKPNSVRQYVANNRDLLGLSKRTRYEVKPYKSVTEFDKLWYGSVPFGHWSITKSWSKQQ